MAPGINFKGTPLDDSGSQTSVGNPAGRVGEDRGSARLGYSSLLWLASTVVAVLVGLVQLTNAPIDERMLVISVLLAGAAGGSLQSLQSLVAFLGNGAFQRAWMAYYMLRPALGAATAFVSYAILRATFIGGGVEASRLNYYGILGLSFVTGLFSRAVVARVSLLVEVAFGTTEGKEALQEASLSPRKPIKKLDRYHGFLVHHVAEDRRSVDVLLQSHRPDNDPSVEIDIGEGPPVRPALFRVAVHSTTATCDVEPTQASLLVKPGQHESEKRTFVLTCASEENEPEGLIELTNKGRTVALVPLRRRESTDAKR